MRCHIDRNGYLTVQADTETELFALKLWWDDENRGVSVNLERIGEQDDIADLSIERDDLVVKLRKAESAVDVERDRNNKLLQEINLIRSSAMRGGVN